MAKRATEGLQPARPWELFEEICGIPRGSGNERGIARYFLDFARGNGLWAHCDDALNVYIKKPAAPGYEHLPAVILQSHEDMVCVAADGVEHDFTKDPIKLKIVGDRVMAEGTTLGADDGNGVCFMLAVLEDKTLKHPALECVFTSGEELGCLGASKVDASLLTGDKMINLDAGPEGKITVSCAGGMNILTTVPLVREPAQGPAYKVAIDGLLGGHSGMEMGKQRGNANKMMARVLYRVIGSHDIRLADIWGGDKMNAIPRFSGCIFAVSPGEANAAITTINAVSAEMVKELARSDPGFHLRVEPAKCGNKVFDAESTRKALQYLHLLPNGVQRMSVEIDGLIESSINISTVAVDGDRLVVGSSARSSNNDLKRDSYTKIELLGRLFGGRTVITREYSGWAFAPKSRFRDLCLATFKEQYGREMNLYAVHGGMEPGLFLEKMPGLDIIAFSSTTDDWHTPNEWMDIPSFGRTYTLLVRLLEKLDF